MDYEWSTQAVKGIGCWPIILNHLLFLLKPIVHPDVPETVLDMTLFNYFPDGRAITAFHPDIKYITQSPDDVYMICLGEERIFQFKPINPKTNPYKTFTITLKPGMLIHITKECNRLWNHGRPKCKTKKPSYSWSFRQNGL